MGKLPRLLQAVDIVAGRLTFVAVTDRDAFASVIASQHMIEYNVDRELVRPASNCPFRLLLWHTLLSPHRLINLHAGVLALLQGLWPPQSWARLQILSEDGPDAAGESRRVIMCS